MTVSTANHSHSNLFFSFLFFPFYHLLYMDMVMMVYKFYSMALEDLEVLFCGLWVKGSATAWVCRSSSMCIWSSTRGYYRVDMDTCASLNIKLQEPRGLAFRRVEDTVQYAVLPQK